MRYLILYSKHGGPMFAYRDRLEDAASLAALLQQMGYSVQLWAVGENGASEVKETCL